MVIIMIGPFEYEDQELWLTEGDFTVYIIIFF